MGEIHVWIGLAAQGIETLAVVIMVSFIIVGTARWILHSAKKIEGGYARYRALMGKTLLVGLELLVAADIIRTVALNMTPISLAMLGGIVVVRTFLEWALIVEMEGRWPWQGSKEASPGTGGEPTKNTVT